MFSLKFKFNIYLNFKMLSFLCKNRIQINQRLRDFCIKSTNESIRKLSEKYNQERNSIRKDLNFSGITKYESLQVNYIDLIFSILSSTSLLGFLKYIFFMSLPSSYYCSSLSDKVQDTMPTMGYCLPKDLFSVDTYQVETDIHEPHNVLVFQSPTHPSVTQTEKETVFELINNKNIEDSYDVINIVDDNIDGTVISLETNKKTFSTESSNTVNSNILTDWLITDFCQDLR